MKDNLYFKQGKKGEISLLRIFAQEAFAEDNFENMLPKLYAHNAQSEHMHYSLYNNDECVGLFALQIKDFCFAEKHIRVGWLGTVCVKSNARGRGYLEKLMEQANTLLIQNKCDIAVLGGQRQRYKRFGYEYGGAHWIYTLNDKNLRSAQCGEITLVPLGATAHKKAAYELYCTQAVNGARSENEFLSVLQSWNSAAYAVLQSGEFKGYLTLNTTEKSAVIYELCLCKDVSANAVCAAVLCLCKKAELIVYACLWSSAEMLEELSAECESARLAENHSYKVYNRQRVLSAGLAIQKQISGLPQNASFIIKINGEGFKFTFAENNYSVEKCEAPDAKLQLDSMSAVRLLLSHAGMFSKRLSGLPAGLFPLPIGFSWLDGI